MELLDKLKQATGADRELDREVAKFFGHKSAETGPAQEQYHRGIFRKEIISGHYPRYTSSVDACLALMGELGLRLKFASCHYDEPESPVHFATLLDDIGKEHDGAHADLRLALLIAIMRATEDK